MQIVSALFTEQFDVRSVPGPSTRLDLGGVYFSIPAPAPLPVSIEPHLVVIMRCPSVDPPTATLECEFFLGEERLVRNVQMVAIEPGKFGYRLVRAELTFPTYSTIEARCRIDDGPQTVVPLTLLPPVD